MAVTADDAAASAYTSPTLYCDVVLKGGVTSGVVYPRAVTELAKTYTFRSIAGTSVGAVAASLGAAAEYRRRTAKSGAGFVALDGLPAFLSKIDRGKSQLLRMFWADTQEGRWQLDAALKLTGNASFVWRFARFVLQLALWYWWVWLIPAAVFAFLAWPQQPTDSIVRAVVAAVLGALIGACALPIFYVVRVAAQLSTNAFGWCRGHDETNNTTTSAAERPLTDWLADAVDAAAGLPFRVAPLTFGDCRGAKLAARPGEPPDEGLTVRMITTCLTLQQPFTLPFDVGIPGGELRHPQFYWFEDEFEKYFPTYVITHLKKTCQAHPTQAKYWSFPDADALPLVVAARMSLSFPALLSAVPLWAPAVDPQGNPTTDLNHVWFSDGGLTSNLPIHLFDNPFPRWPTFAFDLLGTDPDAANDKKSLAQVQQTTAHGYVPGQPFIESTLANDAIEPWERLDKDATHGDVLEFFSSIIDTTRTWRDRVLGRMAGYSDRTIGIRLGPTEGGLNLNMDAPTIAKLVAYGQTAAKSLTATFAPPAAGTPAPWWLGHRWTRYRATMGALGVWLGGFHESYQPFGSDTPYSTLIGGAAGVVPGKPTVSPPGIPAQPFATNVDAVEALKLTNQIDAAAVAMGTFFEPGSPKPRADIGARGPI
jgi:predicted acylesterase/phospholipase RssA